MFVIEIRLAFGANKIEAVLPIMRASIKAAITSNLNTMSVVGIVAIPGSFTFIQQHMYSSILTFSCCCHYFNVILLHF